MTWLTDQLGEFIQQHPNHSVQWYADKFGCSGPTVRKVLGLESKPNTQYSIWLKKVGSIIKQSQCNSCDWENWFDWRAMYRRGLSPYQACAEVNIL